MVNSSFYFINYLGLAKLASIMANKGESLMSNEAWEELHTEPKLTALFQVSVFFSFSKVSKFF